MNLTDVLAKAGKRQSRKRRGRGQGSGLGKTSGRGQKGAKSRSGYKARYAYEGGQMSLVRRSPKRGFSNYPFRKRYDAINLSTLEARFDAGATVDLGSLREKGVVKARHGRLKILGTGELTKSLNVVAHAVSASAKQKIEAAGGSVQLIAAKAGERSAETKNN